MREALILILIFVASIAHTQDWASEHIMSVDSTYTFDSSLAVDQLSWLSGYWVGEGLGGEVEEIWSSPKNGKMYCVFRYDSGTEFVFSEHVTMTKTDKSVSMLVKHFSADFHAWEDKEEYVNFPLIKIEGQKAYFDGCTIERVNDELKIYVSISHDGEVNEELFHYILKK